MVSNHLVIQFKVGYRSVMDDDGDDLTPRERSAVAQDIDKLQATVRRLATEREVLPQPLFWSLFHTRLSSIRKQKEISRVVGKVFGDYEE